MSIANKALAVLAALAFLLPFVSFSCSSPYGKYSADLAGAKLVRCYISPCSPKDLLGSNLGGLGQYIPDTATPASEKIGGTGGKDVGLNFLLFAAIAVVVAAIPLFFGARGGELLSGLASVGVIVLLFMFRSKFGDAIAPQLNAPEMKAAGAMVQFEVQFGIGFWACAVLSGLSAILAFKGTLGGHSPVTAGASGSSGGYAPPPQPGATPPSSEQLAVCSSCGSVNTAGSKFCLSCGASMAAPAAQPPAQKAVPAAQGPACPACGSSNAGTGKFCLACGASMAAPAAQPPEKKAAPVAQGPACPACGSSNAGTGKFCLSCGASMAAPVVQRSEAQQSTAQPPEKKAAPEPQANSCPSCGAANPATSKFCVSCGGSLMAGVQLFQPSETHASPAAVAPIAVAAAAVPAAMAAQASTTARAVQPLRAPVIPEPPVEAPVAAPVAPAISEASPATPPVLDEPEPSPSQAAPSTPPAQVTEAQPSLDWTASSPPPPQACTACGAFLLPEQKFCLACGTSVGQAPARTEAPAFTPASTEHFQPSAETQVFQPAPKGSSKTWIVVVIVLAALGAGGWFAWKYFTRPDVTVTANVQRIHVAIGGKTTLEASVSGSSDTDVDWSLQEGQKGGQVTPSGTVMSSGQLHSGALYTAPQTSGTYHVIATSHANPGRSAKIEIIVGGTALPENPANTTAPAPPTAPTATTSTPLSAPTPAAAFPNAAQIVGTWGGPSPDMKTTIGADSTISMTSAANPQKNLNGTYHFTDNTHLDVDFGNGDARKWEILGVDNSYLRISSQSKDGSSAIIFQRAQ